MDNDPKRPQVVRPVIVNSPLIQPIRTGIPSAFTRLPKLKAPPAGDEPPTSVRQSPVVAAVAAAPKSDTVSNADRLTKGLIDFQRRLTSLPVKFPWTHETDDGWILSFDRESDGAWRLEVMVPDHASDLTIPRGRWTLDDASLTVRARIAELLPDFTTRFASFYRAHREQIERGVSSLTKANAMLDELLKGGE
ncbi:MAG: hypothetical protein K2X32_04380 [Phycisphaerales bacterium]|nr:hypothetical protein [Phycisphaerales bacterium]